jgi:hypothetical protein
MAAPFLSIPMYIGKPRNREEEPPAAAAFGRDAIKENRTATGQATARRAKIFCSCGLWATGAILGLRTVFSQFSILFSPQAFLDNFHDSFWLNFV